MYQTSDPSRTFPNPFPESSHRTTTSQKGVKTSPGNQKLRPGPAFCACCACCPSSNISTSVEVSQYDLWEALQNGILFSNHTFGGVNYGINYGTHSLVFQCLSNIEIYPNHQSSGHKDIHNSVVKAPGAFVTCIWW